jgi:hypothetical protein
MHATKARLSRRMTGTSYALKKKRLGVACVHFGEVWKENVTKNAYNMYILWE